MPSAPANATSRADRGELLTKVDCFGSENGSRQLQCALSTADSCLSWTDPPWTVDELRPRQRHPNVLEFPNLSSMSSLLFSVAVSQNAIFLVPFLLCLMSVIVNLLG